MPFTSHATHRRVTFEVAGRVVGRTHVRRGAGFYDEAFTAAYMLADVHEDDVTIHADGERVGHAAYRSMRVMGARR